MNTKPSSHGLHETGKPPPPPYFILSWFTLLIYLLYLNIFIEESTGIIPVIYRLFDEFKVKLYLGRQSFNQTGEQNSLYHPTEAEAPQGW